MSKHTPGPWSVRGVSQESGSISVGSEALRIVIADVTNAASFGEIVTESLRRGTTLGAAGAAHTQWANAYLIAAAPDLAKALHELLVAVRFAEPREFGEEGDKFLGYEAKVPMDFVTIAERALAKAEGRK